MLINAKAAVGVHRGSQLIEKYYARLIGILGFRPFRGTLNLKLERNLNFKIYAQIMLDHILLDGSRHVEAYLAPARLHVKGQEYDCWAFRHEKTPQHSDEIEIIAADNIHEKFGLKDGDEVVLELFEFAGKEKK